MMQDMTSVAERAEKGCAVGGWGALPGKGQLPAREDRCRSQKDRRLAEAPHRYCLDTTTDLDVGGRG